METVVQKAEGVIRSLVQHGKSGNSDGFLYLKKSQIRKFLTAVNMLTNKINMYKIHHPGQAEMSAELAAEVEYLKVKLVYQMGRDRAVRDFAEKADLQTEINAVRANIKRYEGFARYMEALVAYHKFYGGND